MESFSYSQIREVVKLIYSNEKLKGKVYLSGGIVPWIITETASGRMHVDIDLICKKEDMPLIRSVLKELNLYNQNLDSLYYEQDGEKKDYGVDTYIMDVPVGFYPYEIQNGVLIQRSFTPNINGGKRDLKVKEIRGLKEEDYVTTTTLSDGLVVNHNTLEVIRASKLLAGRQKDYYDIVQIDNSGKMDLEKAKAVQNIINGMHSTLEERKRHGIKNGNNKPSHSWGEIE